MSFYKPPILSEARLNFIARSDQCRTPIRIACLGDSLTQRRLSQAFSASSRFLTKAVAIIPRCLINGSARILL